MSGISFAHPLVLPGALGAFVLLALAYRFVDKRRHAEALAYSNLAFAVAALRPARWPAMLLFAAFLAGAAALCAALAGPHFVARVPVKDGIVVLCIDTSGSMRARDVAPTRAEAARAAAETFVDAVPDGTRMGVVTFASGASLILEPTAEHDAVRAALERIPPPEGATAIGDALTLAGTQLPATGRRIIVLLTDGVNNRGQDPLVASRALGARGITLETVGIGTSGSGALIPGTPDLADIDADALRAIAANGGGSYVEARDAGELRGAFRTLALATVWEKRRVDGSFAVALGGGVVLLATLLGGLAVGRFP